MVKIKLILKKPKHITGYIRIEINIREMEEKMPFYKALGLPCSAVFRNIREKEILGTVEEVPWKWEDAWRS